MNAFDMDEQATPPVKPAIPTPDIPQPTVFSPPDGNQTVKTPDLPPVLSGGVPVRTVDARHARDAAPCEPQAGSIAPFNTRLIAAVIDMVVAIGLVVAVAFTVSPFVARIAWIVGLAYLVARDSLPFLGGQSVGKKAMKLQAVTLDGKSLVGNWEPALIRNGVLAIPFFALIELFILLTREGKPERGRRLGDEWAKTQVLVAPDAPAAG